MKVIGVFGISGVGETTLIELAIAERLRWARVSAGSLVQAYRPAVDRDALRKLSTKGLDENQQAIVVGMPQTREKTESEVLFFDGHLLLDTDNGPFEIPLDVIERLNFDGIVIVEEAPSVIVDRRALDGSRARAERSAAEIEVEQARASEIGRSYAQALGIAFARMPSHQFQQLIAFVEGR